MLARSGRGGPPRLLFVVTEDWYFVSHRLPLARAARRDGFKVGVATRIARHRQEIDQAGIEVIPLKHLVRSSLNPWREALAVSELVRTYRRWEPDIVHHVALKPVLYGSIAARLAGVRGCVNALPGLGYAFSARGMKARAVRLLVRGILAWVARSRAWHNIVQNKEDEMLLRKLGASRSRTHLIKGAGVDVERFQCEGPPDGDVVLMAGRMLWSKGVGDFVEMARLLKGRGIGARFVLLGDPDEGNPDCVPRELLEEWNRSHVVEWGGYRSDIEKALCGAAIVCLPTTYGEGVPKILLEAASCGRPIVAYDVPGCREIVQDGVNGLLVRPGDVKGLMSAVVGLLEDGERRAAMGAMGRRIVLQEFAQELVHRDTLEVYRMLVQG